MKRFIALILAVIYLSTSVGATVHLHYCMGRVVNWSLWHRGGSKCSNCGMEMSHQSTKDGCCKDEHKTIKNNEDQKTNQVVSYLFLTGVALHATPHYELPQLPTNSLAGRHLVPHAPPGKQAALYIRNRVFLI